MEKSFYILLQICVFASIAFLDLHIITPLPCLSSLVCFLCLLDTAFNDLIFSCYHDDKPKQTNSVPKQINSRCARMIGVRMVAYKYNATFLTTSNICVMVSPTLTFTGCDALKTGLVLLLYERIKIIRRRCSSVSRELLAFRHSSIDSFFVRTENIINIP